MNLRGEKTRSRKKQSSTEDPRFESIPEGWIVILDSFIYPAWMKDTKCRYTYANKHFLALYDKTLSEVVGKTDLEIIPEKKGELSFQDDNEVIRTHQTLERLIQEKDFWYSAIKIPFFDAQKNLIGLMGFTKMITIDLAMVPEHNSEIDMIKTLLANFPDPTFFKDAFNRYVFINKPKAEEMGLNTPEAAIGHTDFEFYTREEAQKRFDAERTLMLNESNFHRQVENYTDYNGVMRHLLTTRCPVYSNKGEYLGVLGYSTEQATKPDPISYQGTNEYLFHQLMDLYPHHIYFKDRKSKFTHLNKAAVEILGLKDASEAIGKSDFDFYPLQVAQQTYDDEQWMMQNGQIIKDKIDWIRTPSGNLIWISATKMPLYDDNGQIVGLVGLSIDITEAKIEIDRLKQARDKAVKADHLKSSFLAGISSEMRQALVAMTSRLHQLSEKNTFSSEDVDELKQALAKGQNLLEMVTNVSDVAQIDTGRIELKLCKFELHKLFYQLYEEFNGKRIEKKDDSLEFRLKLDSSQKEVQLFSDPNRIQQIFSILLDNAFRHTDNGFIEFGYELAAPQTIRFFVRDTGSGITKEQQKNIFDRKYNLDGEADILPDMSLIIAAELIRLLGGDIWVESQPGNGSIFYMVLPFEDIDSSLLFDEVNDVTFPSAIKNVLIVSRYQSLHNQLRELLAYSGVSVSSAYLIDEAMKHLYTQPLVVDTILLDCTYPESSIDDLYKFACSGTVSVRLISLTSLSLECAKMRLRMFGCQHFIQKPVRRRALYQLLTDVCKE